MSKILTRSEIQTKIQQLRTDYPNENYASIKSRISTWLASFDLSVDSFTHDFIKSHLLDDLTSYPELEGI